MKGDCRMKPGTLRHVKGVVSEQFFYLQFGLKPKKTIPGLPVDQRQEVVLEVPRKLIEDWKGENPDQHPTDESIAAEIARVVANFTAFAKVDLKAYEFELPQWLPQRALVMNTRPCDHHDNGIRAWLLRSSDEPVRPA
jgi:hypothetical protein